MPMPLAKPSIEDEAIMARYPFLPQGSIFLKLVLEKNGITVSDLIEAHWLEEVRARGRVRLLESVMHKEGVDSATTIDLSSDLGKMTEALSFLYAMLVVCASFNERLLARWVEGEASRADQLFGMDEENFDMLAKSYLSDIREIKEVGEKRTTYWIPMSDFIELCPRISGNYWRLINRPVKDGWVCMNPGAGDTSRQRTARLIKERIREDMTKSCVDRMNKMDDTFAELFVDPVERVTKLLSEQVKEEMPMTAAIRDDWPPCFESAVAELSQGVNVNHTGRLFLASMSLAMGLSQEQTCGFFTNAPDYSADTTSYQINQIFEREYTPHGCAALKTSARCPVSPGDDRLCDQEWLTHPLKYLKAKQRRRFQEGGGTIVAEKPNET
jgi:DNA primase large subunit